MALNASSISLSTSAVEQRPADPPAEDAIKVVCRFRPLNTAEVKAGSKFVAKFTDENCITIGVRFVLWNYLASFPMIMLLANCIFYFFDRGRSMFSIKCSSRTRLKSECTTMLPSPS